MEPPPPVFQPSPHVAAALALEQPARGYSLPPGALNDPGVFIAASLLDGLDSSETQAAMSKFSLPAPTQQRPPKPNASLRKPGPKKHVGVPSTTVSDPFASPASRSRSAPCGDRPVTSKTERLASVAVGANPAATMAKAAPLYGVHFETAKERRWRLRPPVDERARLKAEKAAGSVLDDMVASEWEAKHGWRLSKFTLFRKGMGRPRNRLEKVAYKNLDFTQDLDPSMYESWREDAADTLLHKASDDVAKSAVVPDVVLRHHPRLKDAYGSNDIRTQRAAQEAVTMEVQQRVRERLVERAGPFPTTDGGAARRAVERQVPEDPLSLPQSSVSAVLADPGFYLTDTYKPKVWGATERGGAPAPSADSLPPGSPPGAPSAGSHTASTRLSPLPPGARKKPRVDQGRRLAAAMATKMDKQAMQRYPPGVLKFWDRYSRALPSHSSQTKAAGDAIAKEHYVKTGKRLPSESMVNPKAIRRKDWLKEPWLLLENPPQAVDSLGAGSKLMGTVYRAGPEPAQADALVEAYADRATDTGILDVVGLQMAEGTSGGVASGLEGEIKALRAAKQTAEEKRLGRVGIKDAMRRQAQAKREAGMDPAEVTRQRQESRALERAAGIDGRPRAQVSEEMQAKLDATLASQLGAGYWSDEVGSMLAKPLDSTVYCSRKLQVEAAADVVAPKFDEGADDAAAAAMLPSSETGIQSTLFGGQQAATTSLYSLHYNPSTSSVLPDDSIYNLDHHADSMASLEGSIARAQDRIAAGLPRPPTAEAPAALYNRYRAAADAGGVFPYSHLAHAAASVISRAWRALKRRQHRAAILFQAVFRGRVIRRRFRALYVKVTAAVMRIQAMARGCAVRRFIAYHKWLSMTAASIRFQAAWRGMLGRRKAAHARFKRIHHCASKVQGLYKMAWDRIRIEYIRRAARRRVAERGLRSAIACQRAVRGHQARKLARYLTHAAETLVFWWRYNFKFITAAVVTIQRIARGFLGRNAAKGARIHNLQALVKGVVTRMWWRREKRRLRQGERFRWLREQAEIDMVASASVHRTLEWVDNTKEGKAEVKDMRRRMKLEAKAKEAQFGKPSKEQRAEKALRDTFDMFDVDGSGDMDGSEFKALMKELAVPVDDKQVAGAMLVLDTDGDGVVTYEEFRRWYVGGGDSRAPTPLDSEVEEEEEGEEAASDGSKPDDSRRRRRWFRGPARGRLGPVRSRVERHRASSASSNPDNVVASAGELKSSGAAMRMAKLRLKGRRAIKNFLGATEKALARRRVVIEAKENAVREARRLYREKNPPPYECGNCLRTLAFVRDLWTHNLEGCSEADMGAMVRFNVNLAWNEEEAALVEELVARNEYMERLRSGDQEEEEEGEEEEEDVVGESKAEDWEEEEADVGESKAEDWEEEDGVGESKAEDSDTTDGDNGSDVDM